MDFDYGNTVTHEAEIRYVDVTKGQTNIFSGGIVIGKKIVCMRKNAEIREVSFFTGRGAFGKFSSFINF